MFSRMLLVWILILSFGISAFSQKSPNSENIESGSVKSELVNLGDSPISMEKRTGDSCCGGTLIGGVKPEDPNKVGFVLRNKSKKPILALVLVLTRPGRKEVQWYLKTVKGVNPESEFDQRYTLSDTELPAWAVDWVLFDDGTSWGPDEFGVSRAVLSYRNGRQTAIDRAQELLGYSDTNPVLWFKVDGSFSTAVSVIPRQATYMTERDYFRKGYEHIIESLEFDARNAKREVSRLVAERLKELESRDPQP